MRANDWVLYSKAKPRHWKQAEIVDRVVAYKNPYSPCQVKIARCVTTEKLYVKRRDNSEIIEIPDGHVWLETDRHSKKKRTLDSLTKFGPVPYALIQGEVLAVIWPLHRVAWFSNLEKYHYVA